MTYNDVEFIDFRNRHSIFCRRQQFINKNQHRHAYYEIELVFDGKGKHIINGHTYHETPGDIFLMRLTDIHEFIMEDGCEHWVVEIPPATLPDDIAKLMVNAEGDLFTHLNDEDYRRAKEIYLMIEGLNNKNDNFYVLSKMHLVSYFIMFILEKVENKIPEKYSRINIQLREIITYIQNNLFEDLTVTNIASKFYVSKEYLSSFFKKNTGVTLNSYIRKARLSHAANLIVTTDKKMIEICEMSGFNSLPTFLRTFKSEYGMTPSDMRSNYINKREGK
ncbi:MAG: AraC family transcriptional regulator [Clostridia bacterium]|nr:AraC family transcriptional regulator [Clostridia bacterium]